MSRLTSPVLMFFSVFLCNIISTSTYADQSAVRKIFQQAEKHVWQPNSSRYQTLYQQLHYYPLQPYLDQQQLMHGMTMGDTKAISLFLEKYRGSPLDWPLRKKWLEYLAERNNSLLFQSFYVPTSNVELTCQYYHYQLKSGVPESQILPKITSLWIVGKSQPKVCDPLFTRWQNAGYRTEEAIWQRISLAADGGKHTLIPYLTKLMPEKEKYLGTLWHKVRRDPAYISNMNRFPHKSVKEASIAAYGLKRLIWRDPEKALNTYSKAIEVLPFSESQQQQIVLKFAIALASKNHKDSAEWLEKVDENLQSTNIVQWRMAELLREQDWPEIKNDLKALPKTLHKSNQWLYWYGRSLLETGDTVLGHEVLGGLAKKRHYYGFLAASAIQQSVNLQNSPIEITAPEKLALLKNPAAKRAFEFFHIGRFYDARREWNYWLTQLSDREKLAASKIAYEEKWFDRAIFTLANVGYLDDVDLRFPLAFEDEIIDSAGRYQINPAWTFAIARRESSFMSDANSPAGAKGLMQVMPATAKHLQKRKVTNKRLMNAKANIKLGTKYLKRLLDRHDGNQVLATAAYNAGPYRVRSWLKDLKPMPADIWIETIPYKETREYVKSVMAYQEIYQIKVGQETSLFDQIFKMSIAQ
ncbi:MAG: transglycosylase SLT domain-containing protein [Colwellia sp.]|jgi:soluble lytic murein transglycosylase